jgi:hypothetical protein
MSVSKISLYLAVGFFLVWLVILLAGADFPPPVGFVWIIVLDLVAAGLVYWRVQFYLAWQESRRSYRLLLVVLDGVAIGSAFALFVIFLPGGGEPSVLPSSLDYLIWFAVLAAVGAFNSLSVYTISTFLKRNTR